MLATALLLAAPMFMQADETVKDFKRFYKKEKDPLNKIELIYSLEDIDDAGVAKVMIPILTDKNPDLAAAALKVVIQLPSAESRAPLLNLLVEGKSKDLLPSILRATADGKWTEFAEASRVYLENKDATVRLWAVTAAGSLRDKDALAPACALVLNDPHTLVRAAAVETVVHLGKGQEAIAGPPLVAALNDENISVSVAACVGLRTIRTKIAIDPLITLLESGEGRVLEEIWPTLVEITDNQYNDDPLIWRKWWNQVQETYVIPTEAKIAERRAARAATSALYVAPKAEADFMGVKTSSRQIVFVIDVSGSMEEEVVDREGFRERGFTRFTKLAIVQEELARSVDQLGDNVVFNIYSFATEVEPWRKKPVPANALNKRSAIAWVKKLKPIGGAAAGQRASAGLAGSSDMEKGRTNTYAGLLAGLGVSADPKKRGPLTETAAEEIDKIADTMFFLSDGKPTVGELVDTEDIKKAIAEINRFRKVVIHTIAIGDVPSNFIKALADENGGVFVDLGR
ncbi:MAG: VWA domain-containing protein [Planctomycetes bacterium]|nr:VWA domain-containing protein [Planctomycetota bacterium]MCP4771717.1 VWA domain-containing protein [Planctomycetota bacterium]MCP4859983.1 VWA domain-containing protein [Planctomycetota bacterium]